MRLLIVSTFLCLIGIVSASETISFRHDVMAVLSKGGCNNGGCHGNAHGRGSLRLSLRGEFPDEDLLALTQSNASRLLRIDAPEKSTLLQKPTLQIGHEGEKRFEVGSLEYETLRQWIAQGAAADPDDAPTLTSLEVTPATCVVEAPTDHFQIHVSALFSDGTRRNVSRWAVYEPSELNVSIDAHGRVEALRPGETTITVRYLHLQAPVQAAFIPARADFAWIAPAPVNAIDRAVFAKLKRLRMNPSPRCDDATFIRRVSLDLLGLLPTAVEARAFVADPHPHKRAALVESMLARPAFATRWALKWSDLLRNEEKALDEKGVRVFHEWIRSAMAANEPLDAFARDLVTTLGSTYEAPPANYYRALRDPTLRAEATAQLFLGTRLQCARCHRHPYERWTQDDYYQFAAVFDGLGYEILENERRDRLDKNQFIGEQIVKVGMERELKDPRTGEPPAAALLPIPGMPLPESDPAALDTLATWMTAPENPLFAKVQANRVWFQLMGRGVVDPVDDFRSTNPPINPDLLKVLERELIVSGFNLRHLIRLITASHTYQASAHPTASNAQDERNFSHTIARRLDAEVLLDAIHQVLGTQPTFSDVDSPLRAGELPGVESIHRNRKPKPDEHFLKLFGRPARQLNSDLERSNGTSLAQVFEMMSGRTLHRLLSQEGNALTTMLASELSPEDMITALYWSTLTRAPSPRECEAALAHLQAAPNQRSGLEDLTWALLNAHAFLLRN